MKHAREDYNRIQDPAGLIPDDEPVFLLRGQDMIAWRAVNFYAHELERAGGNAELIHLAREQARRMKERASKMPDPQPSKTETRDDE